MCQAPWYNMLGTMVQCVRHHGTMCQAPWYNMLGTMVQYFRYHVAICQVPWYNILGTMAQYIKYHGTIYQVPWHNMLGTMVKYVRYHGTIYQVPWHNILGTMVQYVVARVNWRIEICSPLLCVTDDIARQIANKRILIITTCPVLMSKVVMISGVARFFGTRREKSQGLPLKYYES